jgi:hypothetical protein
MVYAARRRSRSKPGRFSMCRAHIAFASVSASAQRWCSLRDVRHTPEHGQRITGWWLILYEGPGSTVLAKFADSELARDFIEKTATAIKFKNTLISDRQFPRDFATATPIN